MSDRRRALRAVGWTAVAAVVGYFVWRAVSALVSEGAWRSLTLRPGLLAASVAVLAAYHLMYAGGMALILRALGSKCALPEAFALNYASNLGKYVPGGVWPVVGRYALAPKVGVTGEQAVLSAVLENALSVVAGTVVAVAALGAGFADALGVPAWLPFVAAVLPLAALHPAVLHPVVRWGLKALGRPAEVPRIGFGTLLALVAYYAVSWVVAGVAFRLYASAVLTNPAGALGTYVGAYAAASVGGLLVLFAPGGIGVREGIIAALLAPALGAGLAATVGLTSRLWSTAVELALSALAVAYAVRRGLAVRSEPPGTDTAKGVEP